MLVRGREQWFSSLWARVTAAAPVLAKQGQNVNCRQPDEGGSHCLLSLRNHFDNQYTAVSAVGEGLNIATIILP